MNKITLGAQPYIYPMPTVIVGSLVDGSPNFLTVSYIGIVQHKPPMLAITIQKGHYTNAGIKENKSFSINIPNTKLLAKTDFLGMNTGSSVDKAALFNIFYGEMKNVPMIDETPINLECRLVDIIDLKSGSEIFLGEITQSYTQKKYMRRGYPYMKRLDPILFSINSNSYYSIGRRIGWAWKAGLKIRKMKLSKSKTVK